MPPRPSAAARLARALGLAAFAAGLAACGPQSQTPAPGAPPPPAAAAEPAPDFIDPVEAPWMGPVDYFAPDHLDPQLYEASPRELAGAWTAVFHRPGFPPTPLDLRLDRDGDGGWTGETLWRSLGCSGRVEAVREAPPEGPPGLTFRERPLESPDARDCLTGGEMQLTLPGGPAGELVWRRPGLAPAAAKAYRRALR